MKRRFPIWFRAYLLAAALAALYVLCRPCLFVRSEGEWVAAAPGVPGTAFSIHFLHSVQKTPVEEHFTVDGEGRGFLLQWTRYQSFGVGLPFLASEGRFRKEGDFYVMDGMGRRFSRLSLRTGVGTKLSLRLQGREYRLYRQFPPGTRIDIFIAPLYRYWLPPDPE